MDIYSNYSWGKNLRVPISSTLFMACDSYSVCTTWKIASSNYLQSSATISCPSGSVPKNAKPSSPLVEYSKRTVDPTATTAVYQYPLLSLGFYPASSTQSTLHSLSQTALRALDENGLANHRRIWLESYIPRCSNWRYYRASHLGQ